MADKSGHKPPQVTLDQAIREDLPPGTLEASPGIHSQEIQPVKKENLGESADHLFYKGAGKDMTHALVRLTDAVTFLLKFSAISSLGLLLLNLLIVNLHGTPLSDTILITYITATNAVGAVAKIFESIGPKKDGNP
jgi:hypothetical protein